ncbi:putative nepenthesin [Lupinus albus]|uniref:Putative nepenthesin n=1 Tax=Lupinus albus TaxID=3870 RepID=A0A6A4PYF0_LUPAL|nr:putative nepenthesin [Lupinus albus]
MIMNTKVLKFSLILVLLVILYVEARSVNHNSLNKNGYSLAAIRFPDHPSYSDVSSSGDSGCTFSISQEFRLSHDGDDNGDGGEYFVAAKPHKQYPFETQPACGNIGIWGSREYFIDVFVGTPPKHFSLILDTGSDLNWIQCVPCLACFEQSGPYYDPKDSDSFKNISCQDPRCKLVSSPNPPNKPCKAENQSCPYFYWYGDSSNTTGDFALETFTVNLTAPSGKSELKHVANVMFGCGHWNRGLFHGAAGLLGLGRGPLSFASQLQSLYGHSFSYCLVDRNSNTSVSSKLIFGEDKELLKHPNLNFTSFVDGGKENSVDTFYYVQIKSVMVGGEVLEIPEETWHLSKEGCGGTIIDSGTTLTYFSEPAYEIIKVAFMKKIKGYELVKGFPPLKPCYNVSGIENIEVPDFGILFADGAVWDFPVENYFIQIEPNDVVCLAILGTPRSALSIIGNYQQQNFHILYDMKKSRLGYAPMKCADV